MKSCIRRRLSFPLDILRITPMLRALFPPLRRGDTGGWREPSDDRGISFPPLRRGDAGGWREPSDDRGISFPPLRRGDAGGWRGVFPAGHRGFRARPPRPPLRKGGKAFATTSSALQGHGFLRLVPLGNQSRRMRNEPCCSCSFKSEQRSRSSCASVDFGSSAINVAEQAFGLARTGRD